MGMFDSFYQGHDLVCPAGHKLRDELQTKVLDCIMESYRIGDEIMTPQSNRHQIWHVGWNTPMSIADRWMLWAYAWCNECQRTIGCWVYMLDGKVDHFGKVLYEESDNEFQALEYLHGLAVSHDGE